MQGETPQAGNRARKSFRRHQWSDHAGELGLGSPGHLCVWDGHANHFCILGMAHMKVRVLAGYSRTGSRLSVTRAGGVCPNRALRWRGPSFQCRSCADFKVAVTTVYLAEAEQTWVMMQGETPQAGNRARRSLRRHQWSDHAGELEPGQPDHLLARDGRAPIFASWVSGPRGVRAPEDVVASCFLT